MTYESAPATKMIATHCAVCARPLLDAESVERGIGPDCAKRHGFGKEQEEPNWLTVAVALSELPDGSAERELVETADARKRGMRIRSELADDLPQVPADAVMIEQIVVNLVRNAMDSMRDTAPPDNTPWVT